MKRDHAQAKAELEAAFYRKEKIAALEADAESLLATYATAIPERIQDLNAEDIDSAFPFVWFEKPRRKHTRVDVLAS